MTEQTQPKQLTRLDLDEIEARAAHLYEYATGLDPEAQAEADQLAGTDVPTLIRDLRQQRVEVEQWRATYGADALPDSLARLRKAEDRVAELEAHAYGCDAEGCVIPHSSWCEAAKKTAAENNGCTCGQPWTGHPQPHAMHCWTVNPPRAEVQELRRDLARAQARVTELEAERKKYVGKEPTIAEEMAYLTRCLDAVYDVCDQAEKQAARWEQPLPVPEWVATVRAAADGLREQTTNRPALPWAHVMDDGDLGMFLDDLVSAALGRWRSDPEIPDRTVLADLEKVCADWRTPGQGLRSDEPGTGESRG